MVHAADTIQAAIERSGSLACVGLDPRPGLLPAEVIDAALARHGDTRLAVAAAFTAFNRRLLPAIAGRCAAVKPQVACYEAYGAPGMAALEDAIATARALGIPVIIDGKRNDIGSTAEHYAQAWLGSAPGLRGGALPGAGADWLTVNGYLGGDGIAPFTGAAPSGSGIFVLVKTSNPSSGDLQDVALAPGSGGPGSAAAAAGAEHPPSVAEAMAALVARWGAGRIGACGLSDVGAVVGATYPDQARRLRRIMPDALFLVPGYGAQGGGAADALAGRRGDGRGVLVNSSRGIIAAWQDRRYSGASWLDAARAALDAMNADLATVG